jgi:hypothetical protein
MSENGIAKAEDFRKALEHANVERVVLPSGLAVRLCRPPVFAALAMGRAGTQLQARITNAKPEDIRAEDIAAFTQWLTETLGRLFVQPRFAAAPQADEIGLADILIEDLKFVFRWLRGEVFVAQGPLSGPAAFPESGERTAAPGSGCCATEDLGPFPRGNGAASVLGGSGPAL